MYADPEKESQRRASELVTAINQKLAKHYSNKNIKTAVDKRLKVSVSRGPGGRTRTPEQQAGYLIKGTSWTANSSHMSGAAKHLLIQQGNKVIWKLGALSNTEKAAWNVMTKQWNSSMAKLSLRNYSRGINFAFPSSDPLHMELPSSRLKDNDPRVIKALEIYAKATRLQGKAKNMSYETTKGSKSQKKWLENYDAALKLKNAKAAVVGAELAAIGADAASAAAATPGGIGAAVAGAAAAAGVKAGAKGTGK